MRNLLSLSPVKLRGEVAAHAKLVLHAHDMVEANRQLDVFIERFGKSATKAIACLEKGFADAMAVMALPEKYRRRLRTTNMQERLNEEIRRRERVIRIFPNDQSALRLMGALLAEFNETWAERLYINMDEFKEWLMKRSESDAVSNVVAMAL
jgi:putative transposase